MSPLLAPVLRAFLGEPILAPCTASGALPAESRLEAGTPALQCELSMLAPNTRRTICGSRHRPGAFHLDGYIRAPTYAGNAGPCRVRKSHGS